MRYLKIASAKNPTIDFIELNDFNGFLCTSFQTLGISRKLEFLAIKNRQFSVDNKTNFKKYNLTVEILSKYSEYEQKHRQLITFIDRNKKDGFRLYYRPYDGMDLRYCLCDIESSTRSEKRQPVVLTFVQNSLWFGETKKSTTSQKEEEDGNIFAFKKDESIDYYCTGFYLDDETNDYSVSFYNGVETQATIINNSYNEIPLNIKIYGACTNPTISLFRKGENEPIRQTQILANVDEGCYIDINSNLAENGVWRVNNATGEKIDYSELVNNKFGSPYFYIDNGEYYLNVVDGSNGDFITEVFYNEEYSE